MNESLIDQSGRIKVIVKANSKKNDLLGFDENKNAYRIAIKEPTDKNKANIELIKFLKKQTKKEIRIVSGFTSKEKLVEIG